MSEERPHGRSRRKGASGGGFLGGGARSGADTRMSEETRPAAGAGIGADEGPGVSPGAGAGTDAGAGSRRSSGGKAWKKKKLGESVAFIRFRRIFVLAILEVFVLAGIFAYSYVLRQYNKIQRPTFEVKNVENTELSTEVIQKMKGYWNIAAFGVDSRDSSVGRGNNSDVIMVVSINRENGDIRIASVFRDSYLSLSNGMYSKINAAYAIGGPEQAVKALNQNLDLNITDYITFNWKAVATGVNILGGVDLELSNSEFKYINSYITETVKGTGIGSVHLDHAGMNHLDGIQAVAYARLRYMDNDYTRTERQRKIIQLCVEKAKKADPQTLSDLAGNMLSMVATSLTWEDGMSLAANVKKYNIADTLGFPMHRKEVNMGPKGACVLPATLEKNVMELHTFLFGDQEYEVSKQVKEIDWKIATDEQNYKARAAASKEEELERQRREQEKEEESEEETNEDGETVSGKPGETVGNGRKVVIETDADGRRVITEIDEDGNKVFYETNADGRRVAYETDADGEKIYLGEDDEEEEFETDPSGRPYSSGHVIPGYPLESGAASTENSMAPGSHDLPTASSVPGGSGSTSGGSDRPGSSVTTAGRPSAPGETTDGYVYEGPGHSGGGNGTSQHQTPDSPANTSAASPVSPGGSSSSPSPSPSGNTSPTAAAVPGGNDSSAGPSQTAAPAPQQTAAPAPQQTTAAPAPQPTTAAPAPAAPQETAAAGPGGSMVVEAVPN